MWDFFLSICPITNGRVFFKFTNMHSNYNLNFLCLLQQVNVAQLQDATNLPFTWGHLTHQT